MEYGGAGIAQLPQLVVGHLGDGHGVIHQTGVGHQDTGNVGPVLINGGSQRRGGQGAGDIAAAPGEGADLAVRHLAVEAGDHGAVTLEMDVQRFVGGLLIHGAVETEPDPVRGINELEAQVGCHQLGGEIFAPADQLLPGDLLRVHALLQRLPLRLHVPYFRLRRQF